jgi:hypothetical protein
MHVLKPPARCPICGDLPEELAKKWAWRLVNRRFLRYPVALAATYRCGARIEARYVIREGLAAHLGGAEWRLDVAAGCRQYLGDVLVQLMPPRRRR